MKPKINKFYYEYEFPNKKNKPLDTVEVTRVFAGSERLIIDNIRVWMCQVIDSAGAVRTAWIDANDLMEKDGQNDD